MKKNFLRVWMCAGACAAAIMGNSILSYASTVTSTATSTEADSTSSSETDKRGKGQRKDDGSVTGKIVEMDDNTLTVFMEEKPEKSADGETPPEKPADGETPPEKPADGETPPEKPADGETPPEKPADGETPPEKPADGETPPEKPADGETRTERKNGMKERTYSTETTTLTITDDTIITKGKEKTEASVDALTADCEVRMILDGTTIVSIEIMGS